MGSVIPNSSRLRTGCHTCRLRHLKCDENAPVCGRCAKAGRECKREAPKPPLQFRHSHNPSRKRRKGDSGERIRGEGYDFFSEDDIWTPVPRSLSFVDETQSVTTFYATSPDCGKTWEYNDVVDERLKEPGLHDVGSHDSESTFREQRHSHGSFDAVAPPTTTIPERDSTAISIAQLLSPASLHEHSARGIDLDRLVVDDDVGADISLLWASTTSPPTSCGEKVLDTPQPLGSLCMLTAQEAFLLQLFRNKLGTWMDSTDSERHFSIDASERALGNPILLYAILAYAARHLARVADFDGTVSDDYHVKCLELLIPALDNDVGDYAELLAATVILRLFEQITVRDSPMTDEQRHLSGGSAFVSAQRSCADRGGLLEASFWVYIREDIYAALLQQRPMKADIWSCDVRMDFNSSERDCCKWSNWMVWLVAETIMFSFGAQDEDQSTAFARWELLWNRVDEWRAKKPPGFAPIFFRDRDPEKGKHFPQIYHSQLWHVVGWQYFHLAKILLLAHKPARPRVGLHFQRNLQDLQDEVVAHLRALVGLCLCSGQVAPRYQASMGVLACGSWVTDSSEQHELLHLLARCDSENAWPTATIIHDLKEEWAAQAIRGR